MRRKQSILAVLLAVMLLLVSMVSFAGCEKKYDEDFAVNLIQAAFPNCYVKIKSGRLIIFHNEITLYCQLKINSDEPQCYSISQSTKPDDSSGKITTKIYKPGKAPTDCNNFTELDYKYINNKLNSSSKTVATLIILAILVVIVIFALIVLPTNRKKG